jgi:hypothetical protein
MRTKGELEVFRESHFSILYTLFERQNREYIKLLVVIILRIENENREMRIEDEFNSLFYLLKVVRGVLKSLTEIIKRLKMPQKSFYHLILGI